MIRDEPFWNIADRIPMHRKGKGSERCLDTYESQLLSGIDFDSARELCPIAKRSVPKVPEGRFVAEIRNAFSRLRTPTAGGY